MRDQIPHGAAFIELPAEHPMARHIDNLARAADHAAKVEAAGRRANAIEKLLPSAAHMASLDRIARQADAIARQILGGLVPINLPAGELAALRADFERAQAVAPPPLSPSFLAFLERQHDAAMAFAKASPMFDVLTRGCAL